MQLSARLTRQGFASAMITLGVMGLVIRELAPIWGPVPAWVGWRTGFAILASLVALGTGIGLLVRRAAPAAATALVTYTALWWLLFKAAAVVRAPLSEGSWLVAGMYGVLLAGAWTLYADLVPRPVGGRDRTIRLARLFFGLSLIPIGLSHFVYLSITVGLVPSWLPFRTAWAYLTGAAHVAAGLGVLFGVLPRAAALLESAMIGAFTVLVWVPAVVVAPSVHRNWTELWVSWALTVAAGVVAAHVPGRRADPTAAVGSS